MLIERLGLLKINSQNLKVCRRIDDLKKQLKITILIIMKEMNHQNQSFNNKRNDCLNQQSIKIYYKRIMLNSHLLDIVEFLLKKVEQYPNHKRLIIEQ